jgi:hypothetical protein
MSSIESVNYLHVLVYSWRTSFSQTVHDKHFFSDISWITQEILEVVFIMCKVLSPISKQVRAAQAIDIAIGSRISRIHINKQAIMINNHSVVNTVHRLSSNIPKLMTLTEGVAHRATDLDQSSIDEPDASLETRSLR